MGQICQSAILDCDTQLHSIFYLVSFLSQWLSLEAPPKICKVTLTCLYLSLALIFKYSSFIG